MRYDPGLQPERTSLSWNRTSLSMVVGAVAGLKVLPGLLGGFGVAVAVGLIVAGGTLGLVAHHHADRGLAVLLARNGFLPDGRRLFVVAVVASLVAAVAIVTVAHLVALR